MTCKGTMLDGNGKSVPFAYVFDRQ